MKRAPPACRCRGVSTLALVAVVLLAALLVASHAELNLGLTRQASQDMQRAAQARQLAQAGLEWGIALLNSPLARDAHCAPDPAGMPGPPALAACRLDGGHADTPACHCPAAAADATTPSEPGFLVAFEAQPDGAVRLASRALPHAAVSIATVRTMPMLFQPPRAALTCGHACTIAGALASTDPLADAALAVAGGPVQTLPSATLQGPAGTPAAQGLLAHDRDLALRHAADPDCSRDLLFKAFFNVSPAQFEASARVRQIDCPTDCTAGLQTAIAAGWRLFHFPAGLTLASGTGAQTWGSTAEPLIWVVSGPVNLTGDHALHGLLLLRSAQSSTWPLARLEVEGALAGCGALHQGLHTRVRYSAPVLGRAMALSQRWSVAPGGWKDFE